MIVRARHPAAVRHVPAGGRHERVAIVALEHDVRLTIGDDGGFEPLHDDPDTDGVFVSEGRLWWRPDSSSPDPRDERGGGPYGIDEFAAWLAAGDGPAAGPAARMLAGHLRRSPLVAATVAVGKRGHVTLGTSRGDGHPIRSRHVLSDLREGAGARLQSYLDDSIRIVGGHLLVRFDPLTEVERFGANASAYVLTSPQHGEIPPRLVRIDRVAEMARIDPGHPETLMADPAQAILDAWGKLADPGGDDRALALALPAAIETAVASLPGFGAQVPPRVSDIAWQLRPHADRGITGWIEAADVAPVLALCEEAAAILATVGPQRWSSPWSRMDAHLRSGLVTGLGRGSPEDEASLSALSPGPR